jgi:hypothetical protein
LRIQNGRQRPRGSVFSGTHPKLRLHLNAYGDCPAGHAGHDHRQPRSFDHPSAL